MTAASEKPVVRPARESDLPQLVDMLDKVDPGMVTMPQTEADMAARIEQSLEAFEKPSGTPEGEAYFLVLDEDGRLAGTSSIFTNLGATRPFYSYRISRQSKLSPETSSKVELDILHLVNDYHGDSELGTLFLVPEARGGGRGRLLSFARLMLIAADPIRFGPRVMAEIRGWVDETGKPPFWEAVGRHFFGMDFNDADGLSARDSRFIADLMPRYPIYVDLLPDEARAAIARPNTGAAPAKALLESQGFRYNSQVDIFDGGPDIDAYTETISIVRDAERASAGEWAGGDPAKGLLSFADFKRFAVVQTGDDEARGAALERLGAGASDEILFYPLGSKSA